MRFQNDIILRLADGIPAGKEGANVIYSSLDADYLAKSPPSCMAGTINQFKNYNYRLRMYTCLSKLTLCVGG